MPLICEQKRKKFCLDGELADFCQLSHSLSLKKYGSYHQFSIVFNNFTSQPNQYKFLVTQFHFALNYIKGRPYVSISFRYKPFNGVCFFCYYPQQPHPT